MMSLRKYAPAMGALMALTAVVTLNPQIAAASADYQPPESRLETKAGRSTELYVDPGFNFSNQRQITLDLLALDSEGEPLGKRLVFISGRAGDDNILDSSFSLLGMARTDESGAVYKQMEIGNNIDQLEITIKAVGIENSVQIALGDSLYVEHVFE